MRGPWLVVEVAVYGSRPTTGELVTSLGPPVVPNAMAA